MSDEELEWFAIKYRFESYWLPITRNHLILDRQVIIRQLVARDEALAKQIPDKKNVGTGSV
jgi:hypothetical protein